MGSIYRIVNIVTGAVYIGSCLRTIEHRWAAHKKDLRAGKHHSRHLQRAWNKYGEAAFRVEPVEESIPPERLLEREQHYLDERKKDHPRAATYNVCWTAGNCRGRKFSAATLRKLSESHKGIKRTEEGKRKQAETWTQRYGKPCSLRGPDGTLYDDIRNLRAFARLQGVCPAGLRGVVTRKLNQHKGWTRADYVRLIYTTVAPSGERFDGITNLKAFCLEQGLPYKGMHKVLRGETRTCHGWRVTANRKTGRRKGRIA